MEIKTEKVTFIRHKCKDGHVDICACDMADNPNSELKACVVLNAIVNYIRFNDEQQWHRIHSRKQFIKYDEYTIEEIKKMIVY